MTLYWLLYGLLITSVVFDVRYSSVEVKRFILLLLGLLFLLFRGLRWDTGTDWGQYLNVFHSAQWDNIFSFHRYGDEFMEFGYVFLNVLIKSVFGHYSAFLLIVNAFVLISYARFSWRFSLYPLIAFAILMLSYGFFPVRQNLAIAIALYAFPYFFKRQHLGFVAVVLAAFSVHTSAIVLLFMYGLRKPFPVAFSLFASIASFFLGAYIKTLLIGLAKLLSVFGGLFSNRILVYLDFFSVESNRGVAGMVLSLIFYLLFVLYRPRVSRDRLPVYNVFLNMFVLTAVISNLFSAYFVELGRIASLFAFSGSVLLAELFHYVNKQESKLLVLGYFVLCCYLFYRFYGWLDFFPQVHFPYQLVTF